MACRGVHFAIDEKQAKLLLAAKNKDSDDDVLEIIEEIEDDWNE